MKYAYALLFLAFMVSCNQYDSAPQAYQQLPSVQATPLALVSQSTDLLNNGEFKAQLGDVTLTVSVENGVMKWMVPQLENGEYNLILTQNGQVYQQKLHVQEGLAAASPEAYIQELNEELNLGMSPKEIAALNTQQQREIAQFLASNKSHIKAEKNRVQVINANATSASYRSLNLGESVTFEVISAEYWNGSGIFATAGQAFEVRASGSWKDWYIGTDANGYNSWQLALFTLLRRSSGEPWFKLIAATNQSKLYTVGSYAVIRPETGPLDFFANDAPGFYWNNYGSITVTVTRVE